MSSDRTTASDGGCGYSLANGDAPVLGVGNHLSAPDGVRGRTCYSGSIRLTWCGDASARFRKVGMWDMGLLALQAQAQVQAQMPRVRWLFVFERGL